jgi:hypothetical protein
VQDRRSRSPSSGVRWTLRTARSTTSSQRGSNRGAGPGTRFFAERLGITPDELAADPNALSRILQESRREVLTLIRRSASCDLAEREAARRELETLREQLLAAEGEAEVASGGRFRARLNEILRDLVERLEAAVEQTKQDRTGPRA